jgi:hypothetical protein
MRLICPGLTFIGLGETCILDSLDSRDHQQHVFQRGPPRLCELLWSLAVSPDTSEILRQQAFRIAGVTRHSSLWITFQALWIRPENFSSDVHRTHIMAQTCSHMEHRKVRKDSTFGYILEDFGGLLILSCAMLKKLPCCPTSNTTARFLCKCSAASSSPFALATTSGQASQQENY